MNEPLVSVVMPTYNHAHFIKEAIDSVLGQTYNNLELIIVDNYSEDETREVIEGYTDDRIRYMQFRNNGIIAASRNRGIEQAQGDYVAFIDSDDAWLPEKIRLQVDVMQSDTRRGISFGKFKVISPDAVETGKIMGPKDPHMPAGVYARLIKANFIVSSSTLVRKKALNDVGHFDESPELRCSEDFDLWLRILRKYRPAFVDEIVGVYRMHATNQSGDELRLKRALAVIDKHFKNGWIDQYVADAARASFYFQVGWTLVGKEPRRAREYCRQAIKHHPTNPRILAVSSLAIGLSAVPGVYQYLRKHKMDKRLSERTINHQNL
ncbi:MAG: glycosyltransferase [Candidatus Omnitrophica bacterium]|nr:glycosyltransferase [Candidatus Omnitrophota bacterium]